MPFERRTRATLRSAEFGFFGVCVRTWVQTPRFCGEPFLPSTLRRRFEWELKLKRNAGAPDFFDFGVRPLRTSWLMVGIAAPLFRANSVRPESGHGWGPVGAISFWARKQAEKPVREQRPDPPVDPSRLQALSFATCANSKSSPVNKRRLRRVPQQ